MLQTTRPTLLAGAALVGLTAAAQAADMGVPLRGPQVLGTMADPGSSGASGWYLRGDIGWQNVQLPAVTGDFATIKGVDNIVTGGLGGGYQFNDWLRASRRAMV